MQIRSADWWLGRTPEQKARKAHREAAYQKAKAQRPLSVYQGMALYMDHITGVSDQGPMPLHGVHAYLEKGSDLRRRITATRVLAVGVLALAARKTEGGEWWLTIGGPAFSHTVQVSYKDQAAARQFVSAVNNASSSA